MKHIEVVAAIIKKDNKVLSLKRGPHKYPYIAYKYEFPGGKIEEGENFKSALKRELMEEMDIHIGVEAMEFFMTVTHEYPDFKVTMHTYICPFWESTFRLNVHQDAVWLTRESLFSVDWAAADLPVVDGIFEVIG